MENTEKIALFVGADITAHLVLNKAVPEMIRSGYEPIIFLPAHKSSLRADLPELREAAFYERKLTNDFVYPYLERHPYPGKDKNLSPKELANAYNLHCETVDNVNDPDFVKKIHADENIVGALSIRCFQIFKSDIINIFNKRNFFLNLHPGILPKYRGVLSTVRAMAAEEKEYGWTLHNVDEGIDTGDIHWIKAQKLDLTKTGLLANIDMASIGADSIKRALEELDSGNILKGHPQDASKGQYFTYPTAEEVAAWRNKGMKLADPLETKNVLVSKFSDSASRHGRMLSDEISRAIDIWRAQNSGPHQNSRPTDPPRKASFLMQSREVVSNLVNNLGFSIQAP